MKIAFPAVFTAPTHPGDSIDVVFPDIPGCFSGGQTLSDAFLNAGEALTGHLSLLVEGGDDLPSPSTLDAARAAYLAEPAEAEEIGAVLLVSAVIPGRTQRFNITMDTNLVSQIDAVADNRSAFLADAARAELARRRQAA